ncbi:keratin, type I cytoskeletal 19-like [Pyxicephalus adspersus]|uniref:keratin, type I cytoskeletal 19-like n=1 Tax=Pyxicephalus adspersus TaxID=30357 RepID=UPI003B5A6811
MKSKSSTASTMFKYASFYFAEHGGLKNSHSGPSIHKVSHEKGGLSLGRTYKMFGHSKTSHHKRVNSPTLKESYNSCHGESSESHRSSSSRRSLRYKENSQSCGQSYNMQSGESHSDNYGNHGKSKNLFTINERETMQYLNERLASYLEKVRTLEQENGQLEKKISEWYENNAPSALPDTSKFLKTINELQKKIFSATVENSSIALEIDNSKWATDDFSNKYEIELRLKNNVEADIKGLQRLLEGVNKEKLDLDMQVKELQEELQEMKKNHEEEVKSLNNQLGARVTVEVEAPQSVDLSKILDEIREQYEDLMENNKAEAEKWFLAKTEELNSEVASGSEQLQSVQTEVIDLRRTIQTLEIELQSQLSLKSALENTLAETEATFGAQLAQLQCLINGVESQLAQIRSDLERQNQEYKILMDQKTHLEMEIATYKRLLEGHDIQISPHNESSPPDQQHSPPSP